MVTSTQLQFDAQTWNDAGQGVLGQADTLGTALNTLCGALQNAGACWGEDDIGFAFINGDGSKPGFAQSRDDVLNNAALIVNLLRHGGAASVLTGKVFAATEQANTVGAPAPAQPTAPAISRYTLPQTATTMMKTDPIPPEYMHIVGLLEKLVAGCQYPLGSMSALGQMKQALSDASQAITGVQHQVQNHYQTVEQINIGHGADKFASTVSLLCGNNGGLGSLAAACQELSNSVNTLIEQKNAAREQFRLSLAVLAASFLVADALAGISLGASIAAWLGEAEVVGISLRLMLEAAIRAVIEGMFYAGGLDFSHQIALMDNGLQSSFNWVEFGKSVGEGGVAGGVAGPLSMVLAKTGVVDGLVKLAGGGRIATFGGKVFLGGVAGTAGMVAAQAAFDGGKVNLPQAAEFGFGFGLIGATVDGVPGLNSTGPRLMKDPGDVGALGLAEHEATLSGTDVKPPRGDTAPARPGGTGSDGQPAGGNDASRVPGDPQNTPGGSGGTGTGPDGAQLAATGDTSGHPSLDGQELGTPSGNSSGHGSGSGSVLTGTADGHAESGGAGEQGAGGSADGTGTTGPRPAGTGDHGGTTTAVGSQGGAEGTGAGGTGEQGAGNATGDIGGRLGKLLNGRLPGDHPGADGTLGGAHGTGAAAKAEPPGGAHSSGAQGIGGDADSIIAPPDLSRLGTEGAKATDILHRYGTKIRYREGGGSYYDHSSNQITIDPTAKSGQDLAFVRQATHVEWAHEGRTAFNNPAAHTRDGYIDKMVEEGTEAHVRQIRANQALQDASPDTPRTTFQDQYEAGYQGGVHAAEQRAADQRLGPLTPAEKAAAGDQGGWRAVNDFMKSEHSVTSTTAEKTTEFFGRKWDQEQKSLWTTPAVPENVTAPNPGDARRGLGGLAADGAGDGLGGRARGFMREILNRSTPDNPEIPSGDPTWKPLDTWEYRYVALGAGTVPPIPDPQGPVPIPSVPLSKLGPVTNPSGSAEEDA